MAGPGNPFTWFNANDGYALAAPTVITGTLVSNSATIQLSSNVTASQGRLVTAAGMAFPRLLSAAVSNTGSIVLNGTAGVAGTLGVTIWPFPVPIGLEWTATIASGGTLSSSTSGWDGTGIVLPSESTPSGAAGPAPLQDLFYINGGSVTPAVGAGISVWYQKSFDGVNFEAIVATAGTTVAALARGPDGIIPLDNAAMVIGNMKPASGDVENHSGSYKITIQINAGMPLPAGGILLVLPKALAY